MGAPANLVVPTDLHVGGANSRHHSSKFFGGWKTHVGARTRLIEDDSVLIAQQKAARRNSDIRCKQEMLRQRRAAPVERPVNQLSVGDTDTRGNFRQLPAARAVHRDVILSRTGSLPNPRDPSLCFRTVVHAEKVWPAVSSLDRATKPRARGREVMYHARKKGVSNLPCERQVKVVGLNE
jgi:hypothetical protein